MMMPSPVTDAAVLALTGRVAHYFPDQPPSHIATIVRDEYEYLADRPIRIYVANLVEHSTRTRLRREIGRRTAA